MRPMICVCRYEHFLDGILHMLVGVWEDGQRCHHVKTPDFSQLWVKGKTGQRHRHLSEALHINGHLSLSSTNSSSTYFHFPRQSLQRDSLPSL